MLDYIQPIGVALIIFTIIAVIIFVPYLIYIYRKLGFFPISSTLIVFSFIFYFLAAFLLTMLPLPDTRNNCIAPGSGRNPYSFVPFQFVKDLLRETNVVWSQPATYVQLLKERAFFQAFFNLLLLMPLGIYLRYFFQKRRAWFKTLLIVFAVTLIYEITQVTGIYGIYDCAYRLFDVDDLMLNTLGGILGFFIAPIILALFPSRAHIQQKAVEIMEKDEVRNMPILLAVVIDIVCIEVASSIIAAISGNHDIWSIFIINTIILYVFLVFIPVKNNGQTLGSKILRFRYTSPQLHRKLTKRMLAIYLLYCIFFVVNIFGMLELDMDSSLYLLSIVLSLIGIAISTLTIMVLMVHIIVVLFSKEKRRFFFDEYSNLIASRNLASHKETADKKLQ